MAALKMLSCLCEDLPPADTALAGTRGSQTGDLENKFLSCVWFRAALGRYRFKVSLNYIHEFMERPCLKGIRQSERERHPIR